MVRPFSAPGKPWEALGSIEEARLLMEQASHMSRRARDPLGAAKSRILMLSALASMKTRAIDEGSLAQLEFLWLRTAGALRLSPQPERDLVAAVYARVAHLVHQGA